jgi:RND family efflux transporter MFP subunit
MRILAASLIFAGVAAAQLETALVESRALARTVKLPGEFQPFESVDIYARVNGFVERVRVDRGSRVRQGEVLLELSAPEMKAQIAEAESKIQAARAQKAEAEAKLVTAESTYERMRKASQTPGAVAGIELTIAQNAVAAARAQVEAVASSVRAAQAARDAQADLEKYLIVRAPFDGAIAERNAHQGALAGPAGANSRPLLRLEQTSRLRLVVAVPETHAGGVARGTRVGFTVPAYPGESFEGRVARVGSSLDVKTRTLPVELDVANARARLAPGMYPEVEWPLRSEKAALVVPATAVAVTQERSFVIRVRGGKAEWVDVTKGSAAGDGLVSVLGDLKAGDVVLKRATEEVRPGAAIAAKK